MNLIHLVLNGIQVQIELLHILLLTIFSASRRIPFLWFTGSLGGDFKSPTFDSDSNVDWQLPFF